MKKIFGCLGSLAFAVVALMVVLAGCMWVRSWVNGPHPDRGSQELWEAKAIGAALSKYADAHRDFWPGSLEALKPAYLDPTIDVTRYRFFHAGHPRHTGRDGRVIAVTGAQDFTNYFICIYGSGEAAYLRQGE